MSIDREPPRMTDDGATPESLRRALDAARALGPSPEEIAALAAKLPRGYGGGGSSGGATGAGGTGWIAASLVSGVLGVAALLAWLAATPRSPLISTPAPAEVTELPETSAHVAPAESAMEPRAGSIAAPPTETAIKAAAALPRPSVSPHRAADPPVRASASSAPPAPPVTESELLARAHGLSHSAPAAALVLVDEHAARFPRGALAQEREVIAMTALVASGRRAEAEARAERFFAVYPSSAHRHRIESLLGRSKTQPADQNSSGSSPRTP